MTMSFISHNAVAVISRVWHYIKWMKRRYIFRCGRPLEFLDNLYFESFISGHHAWRCWRKCRSVTRMLMECYTTYISYRLIFWIVYKASLIIAIIITVWKWASILYCAVNCRRDGCSELSIMGTAPCVSHVYHENFDGQVVWGLGLLNYVDASCVWGQGSCPGRGNIVEWNFSPETGKVFSLWYAQYPKFYFYLELVLLGKH